MESMRQVAQLSREMCRILRINLPAQRRLQQQPISRRGKLRQPRQLKLHLAVNLNQRLIPVRIRAESFPAPCPPCPRAPPENQSSALHISAASTTASQSRRRSSAQQFVRRSALKDAQHHRIRLKLARNLGRRDFIRPRLQVKINRSPHNRKIAVVNRGCCAAGLVLLCAG